MARYSPSALRAQIENVIEAACDAEMKQYGWVRRGDGYASTQFHDTIPARASAQECGGVYITPIYPLHDAPPGGTLTEDGSQYYIDPATTIYKPWEEWAEATFEGWDEIPIAEDFEPLLDAAREAVALTTLESGGIQVGGDLTADGDLASNLIFIGDWIGPDAPNAYTGQAIGAFDYSYGAARQETVIGNQRQAMIAVGLCLAGGQSLWFRAGEDIMTFADHAQTAFENLSSSGFDLTLVKSFVDVVGVFATGPLKGGVEVAEKIIDGAEKVKKLVDAVTPEDAAEPVDPALSGGSALEVGDKIIDVLNEMRTATWTQEQALIAPLLVMKEDMFGDPRAYHIHPEAGYDPGLTGVPEIHIDSAALNRAMGTAVAVVVGKLTQAAQRMETAGGGLPWLHPVSVGYGTSGPSPELSQLTSLITETCLSTCQELLHATRLLAAALGAIDAVDEEIDQTLGTLRGELRGHRPRFPQDPGDPRAPQPWLLTGGGKPLPAPV